MFDTILVPCPRCGVPYEAQTKGGECALRVWDLYEAPQDALGGVISPYLFDSLYPIIRTVVRKTAWSGVFGNIRIIIPKEIPLIALLDYS